MMAQKRITVSFYRSEMGREPVREWILDLTPEDRKQVGEDLQTVEFGWPIGMPVCRQLKGYPGLYEVRSDISNGRIARVLFVIEGADMVLLHGFIKKKQKTPQSDIDTAMQRRGRLLG
jgi:phage-related protein